VSEAWRDHYDAWKLATPWDDEPDENAPADDEDDA
jgi:hypothetical protein